MEYCKSDNENKLKILRRKWVWIWKHHKKARKHNTKISPELKSAESQKKRTPQKNNNIIIIIIIIILEKDRTRKGSDSRKDLERSKDIRHAIARLRMQRYIAYMSCVPEATIGINYDDSDKILADGTDLSKTAQGEMQN